MADPQQDIASQWKSFDQDRRTALLQRMTPDQKQALRAHLEASTAAPSEPAASEAQPAADEQPTPGFFKRAFDWAFHPIGQDTFLKQGNQKLDKVEDFSQTEAGRKAFEEHPYLTQGKAFVAGMERDLPKMFSPAFIASAVAPVASAFTKGVAPATAAVVNPVSRVAGAANTGLNAGISANQLVNAATDDNLTPEERLTEGLSGLAGATGLAAHAASGVTPGSLKDVVRETAQQTLGAGAKFKRGVVEGYSGDVASRNAENANIEMANTKATRAYDAKEAKRQQAITDAELQHRNDIAEHQKKVSAMLQDHRDQIAQGQQEAQAAQEQWQQEQNDAREVERVRAETFAQQQQLLQEHANSINELPGKAKSANDVGWADLRKKMAGQNADVSSPLQTIQEFKASQALVPEDERALDSYAKALGPQAPEAQQQQVSRGDQLRQDISRGTFGRGYEDLTPEMKSTTDRAVAEVLSKEGVEDTPTAPQEQKTGAPNSIPYDRLHNVKSMLEQDVRNTSGPLQSAIGKVLDSVRQAETDTAKKAGFGDLLQQNRGRHQRYVETFVDSPNAPNTVASQAFKETNPEYAGELNKLRRQQQMNAYDPNFAARAQRIDSLQRTLNALPKPEQTGATLATPAPEAYVPPEPPQLPAGPTAPKPKAPIPTPDLGLYSPEIQAPNITDAVKQKMLDKLQEYGALSPNMARLLFGAVAVGAGIQGHSPGTFAKDLMLGQGAVTALSAIMQKPSVLNWMSHPTPETMKALNSAPPADAAELSKALTGMAVKDIQRGQRFGISPKVAMWLGPINMRVIQAAAATAGQIPQNAAEAKQRVREMQETQ